jgi:hypothetical protein
MAVGKNRFGFTGQGVASRVRHRFLHWIRVNRMDTALPLPPLSLVIPAYNEAAVILQAVAEAEAALAAFLTEFEILIVDDGSTDGTASLVRACIPAAPHTLLLRHPENRGYGAALRTGFEAARFPLVAFTDADCQFDLSDLRTMMRLAEGSPIVAGCRQDRKDTRRRRFYSWGYNVLARTLLGTRVRDCDCALKVFRREALTKLLPNSRGFFVNAEMLTRARLLDLDVAELPVAHRPRLGGESKVSLADIPRTLRTMLAFWRQTAAIGTPHAPANAIVQGRITLVEVGPAIPAPAEERRPSNARSLPVALREPHREAA